MIKNQMVIRLPKLTALRRRLKTKLLQWYEENSKGNPKGILAHERCVVGIIQAIQHFNLDPNIFPRDILGLSQNEPKYCSIMRLWNDL